jgi:cation diffusion facilitator CzcD-associated flavoprotein CzcO
VARLLNRFLSPRLAYGLLRWRNIRFQNFIYKRSRKNPQKMRETFLKLVRKELGEDFDVETHFTPSYNPWDQRVCLVPDSDLFRALKSGKAEVVTGQIERITEQGILMKSGQLVEADLLVTATGLNMQFLGGVDFTIDGKPADFDRRFMYQGMMLSGVPNLIQTFGYVNASWTLRADLNSAFVSRLINKMKQEGRTRVTPELRPDEQGMPLREPFTEFNPGYMQRGLHSFPKQGDHQPWINTQDYLLDRKLIKHHSLNDGVLQYS